MPTKQPDPRRERDPEPGKPGPHQEPQLPAKSPSEPQAPIAAGTVGYQSPPGTHTHPAAQREPEPGQPGERSTPPGEPQAPIAAGGGVSYPAPTLHESGTPVVTPAGPSPRVARALQREAQPVPGASVDRSGRVENVPRIAEAPPVGDERNVAEVLKWLATVTDTGSLAVIKAAVDGRVGPAVVKKP